MNLKRTFATIAATLAMVSVGSTAFAATGPSKADKAAAVTAGHKCDTIADDVTWEACNLGMFIMIRNRAITGDDYTDETQHLRVFHASRKISTARHEVTGPDRLALIDTNAGCAYLLGGKRKHLEQWKACQIGMFIMIRNRAITGDDYTVKPKGKTYVITLRHGSHHIAGATTN
jgi:hypothetical protein